MGESEWQEEGRSSGELLLSTLALLALAVGEATTARGLAHYFSTIQCGLCGVPSSPLSCVAWVRQGLQAMQSSKAGGHEPSFQGESSLQGGCALIAGKAPLKPSYETKR